MTKKATIKDLAEYTKLSITTISLVLNGKGDNIPESTKEKVYDAVKALNYVPNSNARSLIIGSTHTIGIIIPDISNAFFGELVRYIQLDLSKLGYDIILCNSDEKMESDIRYINLLSSRNVDAIILTLSAESMMESNKEKVLKALYDSKVPYLFLDRFFDDVYPFLTSDNLDSGYKIAKTLYEYGHRNFGIITGPLSLNSSKERLNGFLTYLKEKGIDIPKDNIVNGKYNFESGYDGAKKLINKNISVIFAFNDLQAYGAIKCLKEEGIKIPDDISLIGFDDMEPSIITEPKLTTVRQPIKDIANGACETIISLIKGLDVENYIRYKCSLIIRESIKDLRNE